MNTFKSSLNAASPFVKKYLNPFKYSGAGGYAASMVPIQTSVQFVPGRLRLRLSLLSTSLKKRLKGSINQVAWNCALLVTLLLITF